MGFGEGGTTQQVEVGGIRNFFPWKKGFHRVQFSQVLASCVTSEEGASCRNRGAREILRGGVLSNATTTISTWWSYTLSAALVNYEDFEVKGRALYPGPASAEHTAHTEQSFSKSLAEDITDSECCLGWKGTLKVTDLAQVEDNSSQPELFGTHLHGK